MSSKSPYMTLAGVAGVFLTLIAVNMASGSGGGPAYPAASSGTTSTGLPSPSNGSVSPSSSRGPKATSSAPSPTAKRPPGGSAPELPRRAVYAGHTAHSGPALAIAVLGHDTAAYFCDGLAVESWMTGRASRGELDLTGKDDDNVHGRLSKGSLVGTATVRGRTYRFRIAAAAAPAGLYRARSPGNQTSIGWILLPDGSQVGVRNERGTLSPAPTLEPGSAVSLDGHDVVPHRVHGGERL